VFLQVLCWQQSELQVLGATTNGLADLLWIGSGEHEHHVRRGLFKRLQQRRLGARAQHVHLVEDEHTMSAGVAHRRALDEFANVVDAVVARRIELEHIEARSALDGEARIAFATGFALVWGGAIEHLGKNAGRRGFARSARPRKEVCLATTIVGDGVAEGTDDVLLAFQFRKSPRSVAAVQRLSGHFVASLPLGCWANSVRRRRRRPWVPLFDAHA